MLRASLLAFSVLPLAAAPVPLAAGSDVTSTTDDFDAEGYRAARYRAPVDRDPVPADRLALAAAERLTPGRDALFIDVLPAMGGVRDAKTGRWRLGEEHQTIPGAVWHPEAGRAPPDPALWHALEEEVRRARRQRPGLPVVLFCRTDCWMGWNAARRLARQGFGNVWWLAEGIDGWRRDRPLVTAVPVRVPAR
ncbi:rhodanese-like domain-containing protein [Croceicoccus sp. BE223]|uniref:rhodanese-like domain-containing protein n=1 Tax=Croceicoccus sp. BE223 TaxID=2817716 RepID=UPI002860B100|nr:rhodanese-like domain-containing protein [Croceicoccus sp. BE223]MDR7101702.1 PQQ-dependent catabolism-associated CXXCW motif protein [Croceicoccus sp. BE223]